MADVLIVHAFSLDVGRVVPRRVLDVLRCYAPAADKPSVGPCCGRAMDLARVERPELSEPRRVFRLGSPGRR